MSDEADRKGLSIFDNAATGGFHVRSRGYDREQVERYVRRVEDKLNEATARGAERGELLDKAEERIGELSAEVSALKSRVDDAEGRLRNAEQPSFTGLGDHVASLLKSAEEQSETLVTTATADAERMRSEASTVADKTRSDAETFAEETRGAAEVYAAQTRGATDDYADTTRRAADTYATETRAAADADADRTRTQAEDEAGRLRHEAAEDATAARVAAVDEAKALVGDTKAAVSEIRAAADRDADEQREAAATLLHEARQRADHEVGTVSAGLAAISQRLSAGIGGVTAPPSPLAAREPGPVGDDDTQLYVAEPGTE